MKTVFWFAFLAWAAVGLLTTALGWDAAWIEALSLPSVLKPFLLACLRWGDFMFIALAFANMLVIARDTWGTGPAFTAAALILAGSALLETIGTLAGIPFGYYIYTSNFGPRLGVLPLAIPMAWFLVVAGFRLFLDALSFTSSWSRWRRSLAVGMCATVFDWILEPFAWNIRAYWLWLDGSIPLQNYAAWCVFAAFFAGIALPAPAPRPENCKAGLILGLMILLFLCGRWLG